MSIRRNNHCLLFRLFFYGCAGILLLCIFCTNSHAQDSTVVKPKAKTHLFFQFDQSNSFYKKAGVNTSGFKFGLEFSGRIRAGIGFYDLNSDVFEKKIRTEGAITDTLDTQLHMNYATLSCEYIFYKSKHWQFSVPVQYGGGKSALDEIDNQGNIVHTITNHVQLFETSLAGHYKFFRWGGIGFGAGYRFFFDTEKAVNRNYDSPIYHLGIKLFIDEIFKMIFTPKKLGPWVSAGQQVNRTS